MAAKRPPRKRTDTTVLTAVLTKSARRCALCFHLSGDLTEKQGQVAHLDGDRSNGVEDNLAWMCLDHHSVFDSRSSQHKNYTIEEVKHARDRLYRLVAAGKHVHPGTRQTAQLDHPEIKVEILDAQFVSVAAAKPNPANANEDTYLFVKCRLVNRSRQDTTIRHWGLTIRVPQNGVSLRFIDKTTDVPFDIYPAQLMSVADFVVHSLQRPFETGSARESVRERLRDIRNEKLVLSRGVAEEGWIAGAFPARVREDFSNGLIYLAVMDEFEQSFEANFMVVFAPSATYSIERTG